jgi:hypothetical protein
VSVIPSLVPDYFTVPVLPFTMQPVQVLYNTNGSALTEGSGWQANFVPIPEPSVIALIACGVTAMALLRHRGFQCGQLHHQAVRRIRANRRGLPTSSVSGGRLRSLPWVLDRKKAEYLC